ncbi:MAG: DUF1573 domain-containing protein [Paramuribaculum sp.]|nr:DUF1573 domain-containing protein [Paramuribaculum sp.]
MRRIMRGFTALISSVAALAAVASGPQATWLETTHDFGAFSEELGFVRCTFKAINTGDEPLIVVSARANCGCTKPRYDAEPTAPGDTLTVSVAYDAKGRPGRFEKKVYVVTNSGNQSTLRIKGTVIGASNSLKGRYPVEAGPMRMVNTVMPFGEVLKGHTSGSVIRAYNHSSDTIRPQIKNAPGYVTVIVQPEEVPPGEQFVFSATASSGKCDLWGSVTDSLTIVPDTDSDVKVNVSTVMIVREDFSGLTSEQRAKAPKMVTDTKVIDLGRIDRDGSPLTRTFTIGNEGDSPLIIRRADTPDAALKLKLSTDKVKKGKKATVTVTVDPSAIGSTELLNARITIITNDPDHPTTMVRVVGQL